MMYRTVTYIYRHIQVVLCYKLTTYAYLTRCEYTL